MEIIRGKNNGNVYQISFWSSLLIFFLLPVILVIPLIVLLIFKDPNFILTEDYIKSLDFQVKLIIPQFIAEVCGIVLFIGFLRKIFVHDFKKFIKEWYLYVLFIIIGVALLIWSNAILAEIYKALGIKGDSENQTLIESALDTNMYPFLIVLIVFIGPIFEEMIFRKLLIGYLTEKAHLSKVVAFLISSFSFALTHVLDPNSFVFIFFYLALSIVITLGYMLSKNNIYVSTILHIFNNVLSLF